MEIQTLALFLNHRRKGNTPIDVVCAFLLPSHFQVMSYQHQTSPKSGTTCVVSMEWRQQIMTSTNYDVIKYDVSHYDVIKYDVIKSMKITQYLLLLFSHAFRIVASSLERRSFVDLLCVCTSCKGWEGWVESVAADKERPKRSWASVHSMTVSSQSQAAWNPRSARVQHSFNLAGVGVRLWGGRADASRAVLSRSVTCGVSRRELVSKKIIRCCVWTWITIEGVTKICAANLNCDVRQF